MLKRKLILPALLLMNAAAFAGGGAVDDMYFSDSKLKLTAQEKAALAISQRWESGKALGVPPTTGADGSVRFLFGAQQVSIVCAVLKVCSVSLEAGEVVNDVHLGDPTRWSVSPAVTGEGASAVTHVIIKVNDVGLETSLMITTNRRAYYLRLRSDRKEYMPLVSFSYPEDAALKWETVQRENARRVEAETIPESGERLSELDFNYDVKGKAPWKPVRVYTNGIKTYIQLPPEVKHGQAPTLLLLDKKGALLTKEQKAIVNYRLHGDRFIVDTVVDKAVLIVGVGSAQTRVTIERGDNDA